LLTEGTPLTVSELTRRIKQTLERGFSYINLQGEISNFKRHTSGHLYFTLKDETSQISGVMWRSRAADLAFTPQDGMHVVLSGRVTVYEVRGNYQVEIYSIHPLGVGELQLAFERLRNKLGAEGLFELDRKRPLPEFPTRIGIVTSPTGAALHDMIHVLGRRFPGVVAILNPVRVQGAGAAEEVSRAIADFNSYAAVDVIIVARGGGSLEDLWAFNEEVVARAIHHSRIPVVSAIGHETDFTIADFVADLRAPTPSAAAELVVRDRNSLIDIVREYWYTMHESMLNMVTQRRDVILHLLRSYSFNTPIDLHRRFSQRVDELQRGMAISMGHRFAMVKSTTESLHHRVGALDPEMVLRRGYAMVYKNHSIVSSSKDVHGEDDLEVKFHDGLVRTTVQ